MHLSYVGPEWERLWGPRLPIALYYIAETQHMPNTRGPTAKTQIE